MCVGTKARVPRAAHGAVGCALTLAWCAVTLCCQALVCDSDSGYQILFVVTRCGAHHLEVLLNGQVSSVHRDVHVAVLSPFLRAVCCGVHGTVDSSTCTGPQSRLQSAPVSIQHRGADRVPLPPFDTSGGFVPVCSSLQAGLLRELAR